MADTQHNLRIKAILDTSQLQQEIDRLNQTGGQRSAGTSSTQSTTRILSKLDNTLNKLNMTITRLAEVVRRPLPSGMSQRMPDSSGYLMAKTFDRMTNREFADAVRMIDNHRPDIMAKVLSDAGLSKQQLQVLRMRGIISDSTAANIGAVRRARALNPPIVSENVMHVFPDGSFQLAPRDAPFPSTQQTATSGRPQNFRRQLQAFGFGTVASMAAGQLSQWGAATDNAGLSFAGSVLGSAGAGAMTGAFFGPWGAALGAAFGALSQGALELVKSFKQLDEAARSRVLLSERAAASAAGGLEGIRAQRVVLGPEADRMLEVSQLELKTLEKSREHLLLRQQQLASGDITDKTAEQIKQTAEDLSTTEAEISAKKNVIETLKSRKEALDEEVLAGQQLARAERDFSKSIEEAEYRQRRDWSEYNTSNIQANREALRSYRQQLASARSSQMMAVFNTGIESQLGQIRTNSFTGNKDPVYWFKLAREQRNYIGQFQQLALGTGDLQKMAEYMRQAGEASQKFQGFMQMAQALKFMQMGQPVNRVDLQGLTSLAGRGGWMGEQYRQPEYMSTLEKMYDTLKSIDDNTRAAEKSVWQ